MQTLCPKCGQPAEDGLCPQCRMNSIRLIQFPDVVEVVICSVCGSQQIKGKWQFPDSRSIEDLAAGAAVDSVWLHHEFIHPNIEVDLRKVGATRYIAGMRIRGSFMEQMVEETGEVPVRIKLVACERCSRMAGKYFQSTVQLRGNGSRPISSREMEECRRMAQDMADAGYRGGDQLSFIQDMKEVKGGLDIILGSTQLGRRMARAVQERFGGKLLETCKLVGKKENRDVYRSTLLVRFPRLRRGDIVSHRGSLCMVTGFDGKNTLSTSLNEGHRSCMSEEVSGEVRVLGNRADAMKAVVISKDDDVLEIMDPETFRSALASRPRGLEVEPGEEVEVVRTADGFIVL